MEGGINTSDEEMRGGRLCCRCDYATKEGTGYFCARWNGSIYGPDVLPLAPHVYFTQFLDDSVERERALGLAAGISLLDMCDELCVYGLDNPSAGMIAEIEHAKEHGIPVIDAAELYKTGRNPEQASQLGSVTISAPPSRSDIEGVIACSAAEVTIEGELLGELVKQLRRNPDRDLTVTGEP